MARAGSLWRGAVIALLAVGGCTRAFHRNDADNEAYAILASRTAATPWFRPDFTIFNSPESRLFDPTDPDCPVLPYPEPQLNAYALPALRTDLLRQPRPKAEEVPARSGKPGPGKPGPETTPETLPAGRDAEDPPDHLHPSSTESGQPRSELRSPSPRSGKAPQPGEVMEAQAVVPAAWWLGDVEPRSIPPNGLGESDALPYSLPGPSRLVVASLPSPVAEAPPLTPGRSDESEDTAEDRLRQQLEEDLAVAEGQMPVGPLGTPVIAREQWESLPRSSLARMLDFARLRDEYERSFGEEPAEELRTPGRDLTLENVIELGLLNSREYQTQKETLYRAALDVSLAQFDFALKATPFVNGTDVDFFDTQRAGTTQQQLRIGQVTQWDKTLATSGTILGRLANNVLLTFDGPRGFASDISSQLLLDWTQPLLQRDVRLEPLTRAERRLLYAARNYARFRKTFFVQLATQYYAQLRAYRQIGIESQNYFSLSRALKQARAELETPQGSRIQAEQIEQSMLAARGRLIAACVALDRAQDQFKILLGLPPELPMRLELDELEEITTRDTASVSADAVLRTRSRLAAERERRDLLSAELVNAAVVLHQRASEWRRSLLDQRRGAPRAHASAAPELDQPGAAKTDAPDQDLDEELKMVGWKLQLADAQLNVALRRRALEAIQEGVEPATVRLLQRRVELIAALNGEIARQLALVAGDGALWDERSRAIAQRHERLRSQVREIWLEQARLLQEALLDELARLADQAAKVLEEAERLTRDAAGLEGASRDSILSEAGQDAMLALIDRLLRRSEQALAEDTESLVPVNMKVDDAMLTALSLRLDLINQRGQLADDRRAIKLAADDLRSILNLRARETLGVQITEPGDTSELFQTQVGVSLDLPLNRKAQRNLYRAALINYQAGRRSLMQLEDSIKFAVRDDLRNLALARTQYQIGVASAALANERVNSTRLALALGISGVAARDFLEAQDAYRVAVGGVADNHIGYLVNRMQLFLDLEVMQLDDTGFWLGLRDESLQPPAQFVLPPENGPPYGPLVPRLRYSRELRAIHGLP